MHLPFLLHGYLAMCLCHLFIGCLTLHLHLPSQCNPFFAMSGILACCIVLKECRLQVFVRIMHSKWWATEHRAGPWCRRLAHADAFVAMSSHAFAILIAYVQAHLLALYWHFAFSSCVEAPASTHTIHAQTSAVAIARAAGLITFRTCHHARADNITAIWTFVSNIACAHAIHTQAIS